MKSLPPTFFSQPTSFFRFTTSTVMVSSVSKDVCYVCQSKVYPHYCPPCFILFSLFCIRLFATRVAVALGALLKSRWLLLFLCRGARLPAASNRGSIFFFLLFGRALRHSRSSFPEH